MAPFYRVVSVLFRLATTIRKIIISMIHSFVVAWLNTTAVSKQGWEANPKLRHKLILQKWKIICGSSLSFESVPAFKGFFHGPCCTLSLMKSYPIVLAKMLLTNPQINQKYHFLVGGINCTFLAIVVVFAHVTCLCCCRLVRLLFSSWIRCV